MITEGIRRLTLDCDLWKIQITGYDHHAELHTELPNGNLKLGMKIPEIEIQDKDIVFYNCMIRSIGYTRDKLIIIGFLFEGMELLQTK